MSARPDVDPAPAARAVGAGPRRPGVVRLIVAAVLLTALVQGLLLQSYHVSTPALAPLVHPGERVLVWKAGPSIAAGDLVVVDTTAAADDDAADRATPVADGLAGRLLTPLAELLGVDIGGQDELAVVGSVPGDEVRLAAPAPDVVPRGNVVGTVVLRVWPLSRFGAVTGVGPGTAP